VFDTNSYVRRSPEPFCARRGVLLREGGNPCFDAPPSVVRSHSFHRSRAGGGRDKQSRVISDSDIATPFFSYLTNPDMFYWCSQRHFTDALPPLRFGSFALPCIRRQLRFLIDAILLMKVTEPGCDSGHRRRQYGCGKMHEGRARESICWNLRGQDNDI
jgi:hypothetical protein